MLYEVVLRVADRPDEIRLHDRALTIGNTLTILGRQWVAVAFEPPVRSDAAARVVLCNDKMVSRVTQHALAENYGEPPAGDQPVRLVSRPHAALSRRPTAEGPRLRPSRT